MDGRLTLHTSTQGPFRVREVVCQALGVDSTSTANRAWATKPTVTTLGSSVGQQWFILANTSAAGAKTGTYRLVNRYSGLVLGLSSDSTRLVETTPARSWTNTTGDATGGSRSAAEQTLGLTAAGGTTVLDGTHRVSVSGQGLDDPNWSTATGTQLVTWKLNSGTNQNWTFTKQTDGSYTIANAYSKLCMDVEGGATTAGARVIQWTCTGNGNQRWTATKTSGGYTLTNVHSGLLLTTASTTDGALVTQQADTGSALQQWTIG